MKKIKHKRGSQWNRDDEGKPMFRTKTWGERKNKDTKKERRQWRVNRKGLWND